MVATTLDYKVSSGLSRPDFFDWPSYFAKQIPKVNPDIVVVTFGGNDAQGLRNVDKSWAVQHAPGSGGDDADWRAEYGKRVGATMDYLGGDNRTLIWVGIPNDDNPDVTARLQVQNEVVMAEAAKRPKVVFIDTWKRFSGLSGGFAEAVQDPRDNQFKDVRRDDGFHLNTTGAEILALDIAEAIRTELRARGGNLYECSSTRARSGSATSTPETLVAQRLASSAGRKPSLRSPSFTSVDEIHPPRAPKCSSSRVLAPSARVSSASS